MNESDLDIAAQIHNNQPNKFKIAAQILAAKYTEFFGDKVQSNIYSFAYSILIKFMELSCKIRLSSLSVLKIIQIGEKKQDYHFHLRGLSSLIKYILQMLMIFLIRYPPLLYGF